MLIFYIHLLIKGLITASGGVWMSENILSPVVVDEEKLGKQIVLQDIGQYPLRYQVGIAEGSVK